MLAKLTDVCDIQYGYAFDSARFSETEGIPLVRIRDVVRGFSETCTTESFPEEYLVHDGDILIGMDGEFNIARWHGGTAALNQRVCRLIPKRINSEYIFHFMPSALKAIENKTPFVTVKHLSAKELNRIMVPIPVIDEQIRIGNTLNKVRGIIEARQRQLRSFDTLIKARFVEMFGDPETNPKGWEKKSLAEVITTANNGMARRGNDENGNIVMRLVELQDGYIDYSNPNRIVLTEAEKKRYLLKNKDFLFARVNGNPDNVGRCAVFYDIGEPVFHNDHIIRVRFDGNVIDGPFASALLNSEYGKRQLRNQIKTSAGQYTVSQDGIGAIVTILPPIEIQKQFGAFIAQIDKSKVVVQAALDKAQLLFDSLMQQYFG